ncbi:MAG TPA: hypothetical protein VF609_04415 [Flavisolibacter sp.]|jgi:hypothetical protein
MDYGFAPGTTDQDGRVRNMFSRRGATTLITAGRNRSTVKQFIGHLDSTGTITKPIDDILIGTHANSQGYLFIPMFPRQAGPTTYETLEDTISDATKSITVPDSLIGYTTGDPITKSFHIKGCNIGKATPFLDKLKEAIGGNMNVTAPIHFHGLYENTTQGTWELMEYEFRLIRKNAFATRADYIAALEAEGFTFYNNDAIATTDWEAWVPQNITQASAVSVPLPLGVTLNRRTTIPFDRSFRYRATDYTYTITFTGAIPSSMPDRMAALSAALDADKYRNTDTIGSFDPAHPYPEYVRWGYSSKQDFLDEHEWRFSPSGNQLVCSGRFHEYTLLVPVTDREAATMGNLLFNFYPIASAGLSAITTGLPVTDTNFFATV